MPGLRNLQIGAAVPAEVEGGGIVFATLSTSHAPRFPPIGLQRSQHRLGLRAIAGALEPHLRLRDIRRHVADDALHVLVENVCSDACLLQPMQEQIGIEAVEGVIEALHIKQRAKLPQVSAQCDLTTMSQARSQASSLRKANPSARYCRRARRPLEGSL